MRNMKFAITSAFLLLCCFSAFAAAPSTSLVPSVPVNEKTPSVPRWKESRLDGPQESPMSFSAILLMLKAKEGQSLLGNHYNPGFRLGTGSSIGNWIMGFSFTHYESSDPIQDALKVNFALNDYELAFTRPYTVEKTVRL